MSFLLLFNQTESSAAALPCGALYLSFHAPQCEVTGVAQPAVKRRRVRWQKEVLPIRTDIIVRLPVMSLRLKGERIKAHASAHHLTNLPHASLALGATVPVSIVTAHITSQLPSASLTMNLFGITTEKDYIGLSDDEFILLLAA